jgi:PKD repeat protein
MESFTNRIIMEDYLKKSKWKLSLSKAKIPLVLIIICCLILGGLSPKINSILINNNDETFKDDYNKKNNNEEYKQTGIDNQVIAFASFYWKPQYPDPGEKITFYSNSHAISGIITSERWEIDDGHAANGRQVTHTFEKKGSYRVTLSVTAVGVPSGIDWDSKTSYVKVGADPFPKIKCTPEIPSPGEVAKLDGSESSDPDGEIISYNWSYYDVKNPENVIDLGSEVVIYHKWEEQGTYVVMLFTEDDKGNNNTLEKIIDVSILKLIGFDTFSRGISFIISNSGDITANNVKWNVEIYRYTILGIRSKPFYQKSNTIPTLNPDDFQIIKLKNIRRKLCKIKLVVTAEAENAVKISKSFYGRIIGKFVYLTEEDFVKPFSNPSRFIVFAGLGLTFFYVIFSVILPLILIRF